MTRIEEIESREAKATKGPWAVESCGEKGDGSNMIGVMYAPEDLDCNSPLSGWPPECRPVTGEFVEYYRDELVAECEHRNRNAFHDADFISHAREDIPYLLAEVKRMREALEEIAKQRMYSESALDISDEYDWSEGYDCCVERARAALKGTQS